MIVAEREDHCFEGAPDGLPAGLVVRIVHHKGLSITKAVARSLQNRWDRKFVSETVQVVSDSERQSSADRDALRRMETLPGSFLVQT